jgi:HlyD family secretion protein
MKKAKILRILLLLVVLGVAATLGYRYLQKREAPGNVLHLFGNIDIRQIQLAFHDTGRIQRLLVEEGQRVQTGDPLAELDPVRYEAAVGQAEAQVDTQKQVLARLVAGSRPEEIAEAKARVKAAEAALREAEVTHRRARILAGPQYVSQQQLDSAEATLNTARANLDRDQQAHTLAVKGPRQEDIEAARAQLAMYEAVLARAKEELGDTRLSAPEPAVVQNRILEPGDMASPQTPVFTLALDHPVWVRAYVSEPDLGKIAPGMRAEVRTDSFPGKTYRAWIGFISPTAEFTPKQVETTELRSKLVYRLRVYVCNPQNELRLGMPADVLIPLHQPNPAQTQEGAGDPCEEK